MPPKTLPSYHQELSEFNPNLTALWATFIPSRLSAKFKVHNSRKMALSAFTGASGVQLWEFSSGQWWLRAEKPLNADRPKDCTVCGGSTLAHNSGTQRTWNVGAYKFEKVGSRVTDELKLMFLCESCYGLFP